MRARNLRASLAIILPPALDPAALGAELHAAAPVLLADCLHRAGLGDADPNPAWLAARSAGDSAAGQVLTPAGWHLSRTEAWLCAAIHART